MKTALIPPISSLPLFGTGDFHLLLSHLLHEPAYFNHYREERRRGAYLVLDNSAHEEGSGNDPELLMYQACQLDAQEVVVPDVLEDADGTIEGALAAHETWFEKRLDPSDQVRQKALMYVPQGKNYDDWVYCFDNLVRVHLFTAKRYDLPRHFVIGVSKDYEVWDGGLLRIIQDEIAPARTILHTQGIRMQVHMLGWGRDLWKLNEIAKKHPWIRSTDSAKPFVYALSGINLMDYLFSDPPTYPRRPKAYFSVRMHKTANHVSFYNTEVFRQLAEGRAHV